MTRNWSRREFVGMGVAASAGIVLSAAGQEGAGQPKPVRVGDVGVGNRGTGLTRTMLGIQGVQIPAVCEINP